MNEHTLIRHILSVSLLLTIALFLLPLFLVSPIDAAAPTYTPSAPAALSSTVSAPPAVPSPVEAPATPVEHDPLDPQLTLRVLQGGEAREMTLEYYLQGVLRAEMPASFAPEALKAQAVAARTYTLYKLQTGNHGDNADICTDPGCCQAWLAEDTARQNWGSEADTYEAKIRSAVSSTDGQAMYYGGAPILAAFHASSSGLTRPAGQVWQSDLPYLQAATSPENGDTIPNYHSRMEFSADSFRSAVLAACPEANLSGSMDTWLKNAVTDSAGNVDTLQVGGVTMRGTRLRGILGLRSACFDWAVENGLLVFYVTGYGHGVGMSQYGANAMATSGATWQEILTHYYTGISIHSFQ